jgi:hypothetical protein
MNQTKFLMKLSAAAIVLLLSVSAMAQRQNGNQRQGNQWSQWDQPSQEFKISEQVNQTISHGQQINISRKLQLNYKAPQAKLVAIKIKAQDLSYRGNSKLTLMANQRKISSQYISGYNSQLTFIIPQHVAEAWQKTTLTVEVQGSALIKKITAVLQEQSYSQPSSKPVVTIKNIKQKVYSQADIPLRRLIGNTSGKKLVGLRVLISKRSYRNATLQLVVNGRAVGRPTRVTSGTQSVQIPIGRAADMVMGQDARSVVLAVDGELTVMKVIARTQKVRMGGSYGTGNGSSQNGRNSGHGNNGRSGHNGHGRNNWD